MKNNDVKVKLDIPYTQKDFVQSKPSLEELKSNIHHNDDSISISSEAKALLAEDKNFTIDNEQSSAVAEILKYLEESSDKPNDKLDDRLKCIIIAMRIINGDHVPSKDRAFLAENEPEMYSNAILLRRQNDKPKKYDSLFEDKKNDPTDDISSPITFEGASGSVSAESISSDNIEDAVKPNA